MRSCCVGLFYPTDNWPFSPGPKWPFSPGANSDTTKLQTALKSVNTEIKNTESKLKDINKLLKMDPGNTNLLSQKYKTLQTEIKATKEKLDTLKEAAKQADKALADGKIDAFCKYCFLFQHIDTFPYYKYTPYKAECKLNTIACWIHHSGGDMA